MKPAETKVGAFAELVFEIGLQDAKTEIKNFNSAS